MVFSIVSIIVVYVMAEFVSLFVPGTVKWLNDLVAEIVRVFMQVSVFMTKLGWVIL